ncbi:MAG: large conductance mechanosensitive channel protein MscL [Myxococcota bacterium]|nr:large conductance mechanosensitive channel protein MscL [Myxococcota bacterium]
MMKELRAFILRGNVVDLAVGIVIGAAFTAVVTTFTNGILLALIAALFGEPNFDELVYVLNGTPIEYGKFLTALVSFLLVGVVLFFVVRAVNRLRLRFEGPPPPPGETELQVLKQIRDSLATPPKPL